MVVVYILLFSLFVFTDKCEMYVVWRRRVVDFNPICRFYSLPDTNLQNAIN
jgi:hypothetical protein